MIKYRYSAGVAVLTFAACSSPVGDVSLQPSVAIVYGTVQGFEQAEVGTADVSVEAFLGACGSADPFASHRTSTGSTGDYRAVLGGPHVDSTRTCVRVTVTPPPEGEYVESVESGGVLMFRHEALTPPIDSLRVDVVLSNE